MRFLFEFSLVLGSYLRVITLSKAETMKFFAKKSILLFLISLVIHCQGYSQTKAEKKAAQEAQVKQLVESQNFIFLAQTMYPQGGRSRHITGDNYTIVVSKDTIKSDLPYIGKAYSSTPGSTDGGIRFTSVKFDYVLTPGKKSGWNITIKPQDQSDVREMTFIITESGSTTVNVLSNSRQSISFLGTIEERKKK